MTVEDAAEQKPVKPGEGTPVLCVFLTKRSLETFLLVKDHVECDRLKASPLLDSKLCMYERYSDRTIWKMILK